MATPQHLQIINPRYNHDQNISFNQFPRLSPELRMHIWRIAITENRLLELEVGLPSDAEAYHESHPYSTTNALNNLVSGRNYVATMKGFQLHSELFRVNRESRDVALRFYRVHIPCYLQTNMDRSEEINRRRIRTKRVMLYFNPEHDFIQLNYSSGVQNQPFIDFVHDLKAYDPRNVGLINLALEYNSMNVLHAMVEIPEPVARESFVTMLSNLQELIWLAESHAGRGVMGLLEGFEGLDFRFNHSMPVKAITAGFTLLEQDPRAVKEDLKKVWTASTDPRISRVQWRALLIRWQVRQAKPTRERVLFSYQPPSYEQQVFDHKTAKKFLDEEEAKWFRAQEQRVGLVRRYAGKYPVESPEELAKAVRPAVGFWLFPAEALGPLVGNISGMKKWFDLSGYEPELALSRIS
jgi:hypothetical protein